MTVDDLIDDISAELMGCPRPAIVRALTLTAQHMARNAGIWQADADDIFIAKNIKTYEISGPNRSTVMRITRVIDEDGNVLKPSSPYTTSQTGNPSYYWYDGAEMTVAPIPDKRAKLVATAVLIPDSVNSLPDNIVTREADVLRAGAVSRLRRQLGEQWGNASLATAADAEYQKLLGDSRKRSLQGQVAGRLTTQYRRLGY